MARKDSYPRRGKALGSRGPVTLTAPCGWEVPEGSTMRPGAHGTTRRYNQAIRVGAETCAECRRANTDGDKAYRTVRRGRPSAGDLLARPKSELLAMAAGAGAKVAKGWTGERIAEALRGAATCPHQQGPV